MNTITLPRARHLFASLMLLLALLVPVGSPLLERGPLQSVTETTGRGPSTLACFVCLFGGFTIFLGGPPAIAASLMAPGGVVILAGCVKACADVIKAE